MENDTKLRGIVTTIDAVIANMSTLPSGAIPASSLVDLRVAWTSLVTALALGPEPHMRLCPVCRHSVMAAATRCGFCWQTLRPAAKNGA